MNVYKFRAECDADVDNLMRLLIEAGYITSCLINKEDITVPDIEVSLISEISIDDLRYYMKQIEDSHVMIQTLNTCDKYTGERDYGRS